MQSNKALNKEYILVYSLEQSKAINELTQKLKCEKGYQVVSLHPMNRQSQKCDLFIKDTDPYDFLYLIKHCSVLVTNSFHGLAFSYIFRKKVYCVSHSTLSSRQRDLIKKSGFTFEKINNNTLFLNCNQKCDLLDEFIDYSNSMLYKMISNLNTPSFQSTPAAKEN